MPQAYGEAGFARLQDQQTGLSITANHRKPGPRCAAHREADRDVVCHVVLL
jgi:hypothetical protein